jgi:hypothetical protein
VVGGSTTVLPTLPSGFTTEAFSITGASLNAGTYYVQLVSNRGFFDWQSTTTSAPINGPGGTITSNNTLVNGGPVMMTVDGTAAVATPEPSTLAYAATGVLMWLGYAWRRRKAKLAA